MFSSSGSPTIHHALGSKLMLGSDDGSRIEVLTGGIERNRNVRAETRGGDPGSLIMVIWSHQDPHVALSTQFLASRVRQSVASGGKRAPHLAKVRSDYAH